MQKSPSTIKNYVAYYYIDPRSKIYCFLLNFYFSGNIEMNISNKNKIATTEVTHFNALHAKYGKPH